MDKFTCVVLISVCLCVFTPGKAIGADVETTCLSDSSGVWYIEDQTSITCSVNKTNFPSKCLTNFQNKVEFRRSLTNTGLVANCTIPNASSCSSAASPGTCGCKDEGAIFMYTYTFTAKKDYEGYWDCYVPCLNGITQQLTFSNNDCDNKKVINKSSTTTIEDTTAALAIGLVFGILILILIGLLIMYWQYRERSVTPPTPPSPPTPWEMLKEMGNDGKCLMNHASTCSTCSTNPSFAVPTGAANGGSTGHKATGSTNNGRASKPV